MNNKQRVTVKVNLSVLFLAKQISLQVAITLIRACTEDMCI